MRPTLAALAAVLCLVAWPAGARPADRHFHGDRFLPGAYGPAASRAAPRPANVRKVRKARAARRPAPARARAAILAVPVAPLDAPEMSPALLRLGHFVGEVLAAFGTRPIALAPPLPARPDLFDRPPPLDRLRTLADYVKTLTAPKSLAGFPPPLVRMAAILRGECGARIVSAWRPGARVRGSGRPSLHASRRAVDLQARHPSCLYASLKRHRYAGGYSTDYAAVAHLHMSWGGREHGRRFAHDTGRSRRVRLASR